jgi:hypothetical protein
VPGGVEDVGRGRGGYRRIYVNCTYTQEFKAGLGRGPKPKAEGQKEPERARLASAIAYPTQTGIDQTNG